MAETTDQPTPPITPESWQWAFTYLRENVQDIRADMRELRSEVRTGFGEVNRRIDTRFGWTITAILAVAALMSGLMTALIKL